MAELGWTSFRADRKEVINAELRASSANVAPMARLRRMIPSSLIKERSYLAEPSRNDPEALLAGGVDWLTCLFSDESFSPLGPSV